jgi:subtilisin family serine protease
VDAAKDQLPELWKSLKPAAGARSLNSGVTKIWLDGKVRPVLDKSVPQIGAPDAWKAGYEGSGVEVAVLDTGVDATHPDLAGKVKESQDFSGSPSGTVDQFGHGTHVAATIAGTGAGAGGTREGRRAEGRSARRQGARRRRVRVRLVDHRRDGVGRGRGAKVVNMSLGGSATDGTDPAEPGGERHHAHDRHVVRRRGRQRGQDETVGTPGAAAAALTVGAVDRADQLADFSSRGPRLGDAGLKPEITAPGVGIIRCPGGRHDHGCPVDNLYTAASGTSMATSARGREPRPRSPSTPDWKADH